MTAALIPSSPSLGPVPDLLSAEPTVRIDLASLRQTLVFAFATGGSVEAFDHILAAAPLPASAWDRAYFARDVFLAQLLESCLTIRIGGRSYEVCRPYLLRAIGEPPRSPEVLAFRRRVLGELATSKELRADFERVYMEIVRFRALLCAGRFTAHVLRRLEILRAVHKVFELLATSFEGATSGLSRLRAFGEAVREGKPYRRLDALLDHEDHMGTVDLSVRIGADGELRTFQIVGVRENTENPFHTSPLGRWIAKIRLILRGYRMNGGEVVERLFDDVFTGLEESVAILFQLLGDMEFYLAGLGFRDRAQAKGLAVSFPEFIGKGRAGAGMTFRGLFNPLLLTEKTPPIPCDLETTHDRSVVVVTGPNSGGKTRLLQAIALAQLLGEAGLFVPAREARIPRVAGLFVSLIEDARADQPEGQLGMELIRIRRMFEQLGVGSLVLLDELCSGTNPSEGEEIARLVISLLPELGAQAFITTHLLQFAARLAEDRPIPSLEFLQVELDPHERPTYGFVPGVAKTSLAHKTAARLGVTRDELLALIAARKRAQASETVPEAPDDAEDDASRNEPSSGSTKRAQASAGERAEVDAHAAIASSDAHVPP
jgi:DNA mismatch repair protein MutS2